MLCWRGAYVFCSALLLNSVMSAFRAEFIATRSMDFIGMIKECDESGFPKVGCWLNAWWRTDRQCLPDSSPGRGSLLSGTARANRKTGEGCVSEECRGRQVNDWDCETHVIAESQASVSPKSIQLFHYEIFRKNFWSYIFKTISSSINYEKLCLGE